MEIQQNSKGNEHMHIYIYIGEGKEWKYRFTARYADSPSVYFSVFTDLEGFELLQL